MMTLRYIYQRAVHPHACGEISVWILYPEFNSGTSPRLWGDFRSADNRRPHRRYIPTPVGRFRCDQRIFCPRPVHPHACGEIANPQLTSACESGTSPRLWGDWSIISLVPVIRRYIPTPVGRLGKYAFDPPARPVHPHACGEI